MNPPLHVLFVCGRNRWRSPTAERLYRNDPRLEARSAEIHRSSRRCIHKANLVWADLVLVMEQKHRQYLRQRFRDLHLPPIECLDIPDDYGFMDETLIDLLRTGTESYL